METPLGWALYGSEHGWRRDAGDYHAYGRGTSPRGCASSLDGEEIEAPEEVAGRCTTLVGDRDAGDATVEADADRF